MKKFVSIALAIVMMLSVSVCAFADDYVDSIATEVLSTYEPLFPMDNGWWTEDSDLGSSTDAGAEFAEAILVDGAKIVIKADAIAGSTEDGYGFQYGVQTTDTWVMVLAHFNYANGEGNLAAEEVVVEGDYAYIIVDAAEFVDALTANDIDLTVNTWQWIFGACTGAKTYGVYVVSTGAAAEETTEEAEAAEETTEEAAESTETSTASSPDTGVALALVPMAIAGIAVVSSKRR
ncbi:MAG: hypothetical protein LUC38_09285 [Oscillospiraceae bacterium]|nr:hypothetical protein [Ruminococcus sp.]MCD8346123.1 hypothetical protein [Oscillospiraceae bacterium]